MSSGIEMSQRKPRGPSTGKVVLTGCDPFASGCQTSLGVLTLLFIFGGIALLVVRLLLLPSDVLLTLILFAGALAIGAVLWIVRQACRCHASSFEIRYLDSSLEVQNVQQLKALWRDALKEPLHVGISEGVIQDRNRKEAKYSAKAVTFKTNVVDYSDVLPDLKVRPGTAVLLKWSFECDDAIMAEWNTLEEALKTTVRNAEVSMRLKLGSTRTDAALVFVGERQPAMVPARFCCLAAGCADSCAMSELARNLQVVHLVVRKRSSGATV